MQMKSTGNIFGERTISVLNYINEEFFLASVEYQKNIMLTLSVFSNKLVLQESFPTCSHVKWVEMKADLGPVSIWFTLGTGSNQAH